VPGQPVHNVIFDLGGVLLEWNPTKILADFYPEPEPRILLADALFRHSDWRAFNRGELSERELLSRLSSRTGRDNAELSSLLESVPRSLVAMPRTVALLQALQRRCIPLYCLSDMAASVYA
jgi:putative hydrolase of the HAD superfamily